MAATYKQLKEDFVSGLTGGDILEINYVTAVASVRQTSSGIPPDSNSWKDSSTSLVCTAGASILF